MTIFQVSARPLISICERALWASLTSSRPAQISQQPTQHQPLMLLVLPPLITLPVPSRLSMSMSPLLNPLDLLVYCRKCWVFFTCAIASTKSINSTKHSFAPQISTARIFLRSKLVLLTFSIPFCIFLFIFITRLLLFTEWLAVHQGDYLTSAGISYDSFSVAEYIHII